MNAPIMVTIRGNRKGPVQIKPSELGDRLAGAVGAEKFQNHCPAHEQKKHSC